MEPYTIRLNPDEVNQLEREADERGFGTRTEYIRWIIRNRPSVEPDTAESLKERMSQLEERMEELED